MVMANKKKIKGNDIDDTVSDVEHSTRSLPL